jgi:YidC/Oxa1 family membrane protein insertase
MQSLIFSLGILDSLTKPIGKIFQPLLDFVAAILAFFYSIIPNYPISIALLTIVIMAVLTPLTVKSTKSMAAMQALGPEMKKLQQKYKGAENRAQLNEEMMKLYKEHKVNPASGCLPMLLQMPAFLVLYDVIRGITNTIPHGGTLANGAKCLSNVCADPRYISHTTKMYHAIVAGHGQLNSFGMDFAKKLLPFSSHNPFIMFVPYLLLVLLSIGLQYLQMSRLNARNPSASANPQAQMLQKYMPIVFGLIYLNIPAAVNVYFVVSSAIRIGTQEVLFRRGIVGGPPARAEEKENPARRPKPGTPRPKSGTTTRDRPTNRPKSSSGTGSGQRSGSGTAGTGNRPAGSRPAGSRPRPKTGGSPTTRNGEARRPGTRPAGTKGTASGTKGTAAKGPAAKPTGARPTSGRSRTGSGSGDAGNGSKSPNGSGRDGSGRGRPERPSRPERPRGTEGSSGNGSSNSNSDGSGESKAQPRSKSKRDRKAR